MLTSECKTDRDCEDDKKICDLGRCECKDGYVPNMKLSGVCTGFQFFIKLQIIQLSDSIKLLSTNAVLLYIQTFNLIPVLMIELYSSFFE